MYSSQELISFDIPEPTLRRLPWYLACAKLIQKRKEQYLSSTQIAKNTAINPSKVIKDLSLINISEKNRINHDIKEPISVLEQFLGFINSYKAFGVGNC